ncbi:MAG TPA: DEAD/DEAH box helicase family protein [Patescibacteria group bacterium]|nr:DEAD/DEAH box helicase family protein [Patescibacteria group bacterium]
MEHGIESKQVVYSQRQVVASWIQRSLKPVANLIKEGSLEDFDEEIVEEAEHFEVRNYQLDAWYELWKARQESKKSGLVHLATGLGKTSVAVFDVKKFREEHIAKYGYEPYILFTCHQNEIIEQAAERFSAFIPDAPQGFFTGSQKNRDGEITFATLQSLYSSLDTFEPDEFDYIIYDEAHHSKAETFETVVNHFTPEFQLALTATPNRLDELDITELFGQALYSKDLAQALAEGLLARPDYHIVFDDAVKKVMESNFEAKSLKELNALFNVSPRNEVIAQNIKDEMDRIGIEFGSEKTIIFCQDIAHTESIAELLGGKAYHSGITNKQERRDIIKDFRHGDLQVICTRDMFNEGVDIPDARLLVFLRSTSSQTVFEQQLGRGLRKHTDKDSVSILDFVANVERISMIQELANTVREFELNNDAKENQRDTKSEISGDITNLIIQTFHGDFDFDKLAIDVLSKFSELKANVSQNWNVMTNYELVKLALQISPDNPLRYSTLAELSKLRKFPSYGVIRNRFGNLQKFQDACGFEVTNLVHAPEEELIELALQISPEKPLTYEEINELSKEHKFPSSATISRRFGSITEFQRLCGFEVKDINYFNNFSDEEIINLALSLSPEKPLSQDAIAVFSKERKFPSSATINKRFGKLIDFHRACGFEVIDLTEMSNADLVELALRLSPNNPLGQRKMNELSRNRLYPSYRTIRNRFGGINEFHQACGFGR